ncbi:MFS transporter [Geodermatophilus sp. YIM 151500]|uniref:MFS transporter n=1 Tax=Geodermatophilus sp. YIM 151500 TaxID=2984531 RepID=UPI0021E44686|nr:MFS transporter [Geodermatophilus sp. YIM 151500]MCV2489044.1 MFS transporter [Geodermatophilus sp. YIM 151500]
MAVAAEKRVAVPTRRALRRRLAPLYAAAFLQNLALWVPIEKLFMTGIGFDAAGVGLMAAVYSVVVPVFEVPSGVLADRWSRRGVLVLACLAAALSAAIGGASPNVATYMVSAFFLGIFFAMQSGTFESVVYDTLLEETGSSDDFERVIGRVRVVESVALVTSALTGGVLAELLSLRVTYFLTVPLLVAAGVAVCLFREPRLHRAEESVPLRRQLATTYRTLLQRGRLRPVIALTIAAALTMQGMLEFGPLWLVALAVPAIWYGPHWAGLTSALGLGGLLGSQRWVTRRSGAAALAGVMVACTLVLVGSTAPAVVVGAQVVLTAVVVAVGIPVTRRLHDAVPSAVRAGVASGVGTLTWLTFVPFALLVGFVSDRVGVGDAGWLFVAVAVVCGVLVITVLPTAPTAPVAAPLHEEAAPTFPPDRFLPDDDPDWPGHWAVPPAAWAGLGTEVHDAEAAAEVRTALMEMPVELRRVMVLRDVEGRPPGDVARALGISPRDEQLRLHAARGLVRSRVARHLEGRRAT